MIHPSFDELKKKINAERNENEGQREIKDRYSLILSVAKRARQLKNQHTLLNENEIPDSKKPVSIAVEELYNGKVHLIEEPAEAVEE
ncbi:MAG: DNA-directed RNA polymerase subunit omega [Lachnospiraceae bacterium]|nr:DNA-directed RNA polymerase subunit omega [Lachnospiraceae bacterium]